MRDRPDQGSFQEIEKGQAIGNHLDRVPPTLDAITGFMDDFCEKKLQSALAKRHFGYIDTDEHSLNEKMNTENKMNLIEDR